MAFKKGVSRAYFRQYIAGFAACLSIVTSGSLLGWITPIYNHLVGPDSEIPMTDAVANWVVSITEIGNMLGPIPAGYLTNRFGRKPILLASGPLYMLTWAVIIVWPSVWVLTVSRFCQGLIMGFPFSAGPVYLGEIASDATRGAVSSLFFISWFVGFLVSYAAGPLMNFTNYTIFTMLLNVPFILMFFWQPETPYFHVMNGKMEKARKSLEWFRDSSGKEMEEELERIKKSVEIDMQNSTRFRDLFATAGDRKAFFLLMVISAVRISSGTGALLIYATEVFEATPNLSISPDLVTVTFGVVMLIGACASTFTSDYFGRRPLLLFSSFGCLLCTSLTGTYYLLLNRTSLSSTLANYSWVAPLLIFLYAGLCSAGMYPVCISYTSELFPSNTRGLAASMGSSNVSLFSFIAMILYQPITNRMGLEADFYFYSITTFLGCVYFYFNAPETKKKSFVQIRKELCGDTMVQVIV